MTNMINVLEKIGIKVTFPPLDYSKLSTKELSELSRKTAHQRAQNCSNQACQSFIDADNTYRQIRQELDNREGLTLNL